MKLEQKFPQKRALITGAASGLGLAIAERLAAAGWKLYIADINGARLEAARERLQGMGGQTIAQVMDVTSQTEQEEAASAIVEAWGGLDLLFNNAGIATAGTIEELTMADWQRTIDVDLWSVIHGCRIFAPIMKRQGSGHIINTASSAGTLASPEMAAYNVAKAGVVSLSETLKPELSRHNVGVTVICPTVFVTSLGETMTTGRAMEQNLIKQLETSKVTPEHIVDDVFRAIERNRLYVMTQTDARWGWRFKRFFPELYPTIVSYCYRNRKWIFAE